MTIRVGFQKTGVTPEDHRHYASTAGVPDAALTGASGLTSPGGNLTATGAMTATIGAFRAVIQGTSSALQGAYPFVNDAASGTLTFGDGHATLPRIDLVYAQVRDNPYDSTGFQDGRIAIAVGTPHASPVAPAVPTSAIPLWEVRVNAGVNAGNGGVNFGIYTTDRRTYVGWQTMNLGAWTQVTPVWTGAGSPAIGNGTMYMRYTKIGRLVTGYLRLVMGSTTTYGSAANQWAWSLPVAATTVPGPGDYVGGAATSVRAGLAYYNGVAVIEPATSTMSIKEDGSGFGWGNQANHPFPTGPTNGDVLHADFRYEAAA
jgi:hypothetical protein